MTLLNTRNFNKKFVKLSAKLKEDFRNRVALFISDQFNSQLENHTLHGERKGQRSINITGDYRLVFEVLGPDLVRLLDIDTHHNLYGK